MKGIKTILSAMLLAAMAVSCNDNFDTPPMVTPTAQDKANISIAEFKEKYWQDAPNYIDTVKEDLVIAGRVVSSDASGNIYKSLYIQDESGALAMSINSSNLYTTYRVGQEIVIPLKDLYVGKYNGQQQLGYPSYYEKGSVWEATFMSLELFQNHAQLNGLPDPDKVQPVVCNISDLQHDAATQRKYQGQLVRFENVKFSDADGTITYADESSSTNRNIEDEAGNTLVVRNSNYATFRSSILPLGKGSVTGVLSYYGTRAGSNGTWQLFIRSTDDCEGFNTSTKGTVNDPYTIDEAIAAQGTASGWLTGYVVGAVAPEVTTVKSNADVEWSAPSTLDNTLVIGPSADCRDYTKCVAVSLPQGTAFRTQANIKDNVEVLGTQIWVKGTFANYMGMAGVTGNSGSTDEFRLSISTGGVTSLNETFESGIPSTWTNLKVSGNKEYFTASYNGNTYAKVTGYNGTAPFDSWLISPAINIKKATERNLSFRTSVNGYSSTETKFEVYVMSTADPSTAKMQKLSPVLATAPASGFSDWVESGNIDLSAWADGTYYIGFRYTSPKADNYATWQLDDVKFGAAQSGGDDPQPASGTRADLETLNNGTATGYYGTYTTTAGWTATNCNVLKGGDTDSNPMFKFIGFKTGSTSEYAFAACLNGKVGSAGTLVSPELTGGISTLSFNYGLAYTEATGAKFRVDIKQAGAVVKTFTVENTTAAKSTVYTVTEDINVAGNFSIEFTNLSPSANSSANKDRTAIWNVTWTQPTSKVVRDPRSRVRMR